MKFQTSDLRANSFKDLALSPELSRALEKMNISKPTAIQSQAIPVAIAGSDVVAIAQTGSGKTLAYGLSVLTTLQNKPQARALVLAPSREMAQQIYKVFLDLCSELPISVCLAIGGTTGSKQGNQLKKNPRLIVATPGRMNDHLTGNKLLLQNVQVVVIDEADRMLDMGFAPQLQTIQKTMRGHWQTLMFSASFARNVEAMAEFFMRSEVTMIRSAQAEEPVGSLKQQVVFLDRKMKNDRLLNELNAIQGSVIVFTESKDSCESVGEYLESYGFSSDIIHGDLTQGHRNRVVREFREGKIRILVATDLLARGIDVPSVNCVINYEMPFKSEDFLHRIGRTARAGRSGLAITYVTPSDKVTFRKIQGYIAGADEIKADPYFKFIDRSRKQQQDEAHSGASGRPERSRASGGKSFAKKNSSYGGRPARKSTGRPAKKR